MDERIVPKTVLVADDDPSSRELSVVILKSMGIAVIEARNGVETLTLARSHLPALTLLDLRMPDLDGFQVLRALRSDPRTARLLIAALTASAMKGDRVTVLAAGFDEFITKPVPPHRFRELVRALLAKIAAAGSRHFQVRAFSA